jgi:hypothetical protein
VTSIALLRCDGIVPALPLALGAILFPIGHAIGLPAVLIGGDVMLLVAFVLLAARTATRRPHDQVEIRSGLLGAALVEDAA